MHTYCSLITINPLNVCVSFVSVERISSEHSARETGGRRAQVMSAKHPNQSNLTYVCMSMYISVGDYRTLTLTLLLFH